MPAAVTATAMASAMTIVSVAVMAMAVSVVAPSAVIVVIIFIIEPDSIVNTGAVPDIFFVIVFVLILISSIFDDNRSLSWRHRHDIQSY